MAKKHFGKKYFVQKFAASFSELRPASVLYKREAFTFSIFAGLRRDRKWSVVWNDKICVCKYMGTS